MNPSGQKIIPYLWFDMQAEEAVAFYVSLFQRSAIKSKTYFTKEGLGYHGRPEGTVMDLLFELDGQPFGALNGGPKFAMTPAVSFFVTCESEQEVHALWNSLSAGGKVLMPLDKYDRSALYGWVQDRFGVSWQISLGRLADVGLKIAPCLLFSGSQAGRASKAIYLYTYIFNDSYIDGVLLYGPGEPHPEGLVKHAQFRLNNQKFMVMDSGLEHGFAFTEAISFMVICDSQDEVDYFWEQLGEGGDPNARQCGWLKDKFGVSWQVIPSVLPEMLSHSDARKVKSVTKAMLQMEKPDVEGLKKAFAAG